MGSHKRPDIIKNEVIREKIRVASIAEKWQPCLRLFLCVEKTCRSVSEEGKQGVCLVHQFLVLDILVS